MNGFKLYFSKRYEFVHEYGLINMELLDALLGPLLFHININDLYSAIKYYKVRHFASVTNRNE